MGKCVKLLKNGLWTSVSMIQADGKVRWKTKRLGGGGLFVCVILLFGGGARLNTAPSLRGEKSHTEPFYPLTITIGTGQETRDRSAKTQFLLFRFIS